MCVTCHGTELNALLAGAKLPGLPLDDQQWKYGGTPKEIFKIVRKGSPDITKGMAAWEGMLGMKRVSEVVAFVLSHHHEGEPITRAPDAPPPVVPAK
jgi:cytochrome c oxidase cbb3-type subunit 3